MMDEPLLSQHELAKAAFGLLTSSSSERYVRIAQDSAAGLVKKLQPDLLQWQRVLDRANRLWQEAARGTRREPSEVELAVLLSALAQTAIPNVDRLLATVSLIDRPPVAWLSALARNLRMHRSATLTIGRPTSISIRGSVTNTAATPPLIRSPGSASIVLSSSAQSLLTSSIALSSAAAA